MSKYLIKDVLDIETNERSEGAGARFVNERADIVMLIVGRGMRLAVQNGMLTTSTIQSIEDVGNQKIAKTNNSIYILEVA